MFSNLIESDLHIAELKRRSSFMFGTMLGYALLLMAAAVGSIYAYEAHVDDQSLETMAMVTMLPVTSAPARSAAPRSANPQSRAAAAADNATPVSTRTIRQSDVNDMTKIPVGISVAGNNVPPALPNSTIGRANIDIGGGGTGSNRLPFGNNSGTGNLPGSSSGSNEIVREVPPEMPRIETKPAKPKLVSLGVIESKVVQKAVPPYPELAKRARASGIVDVQILLDERGRVISARATNGHPLLRPAAEQAAYQTRFSPTLLSNQPVKVSGVITFNFVLQ